MDYTMISTDEIKTWLKDNLNEERYLHSLGTADCACELAIKYGQDIEKAYLAGLLHDCAKCLPTDKLLEMIKANDIKTEEGEIENYKTLHAPVSSVIAKSLFKVEDEEILSAIRWHTIGKLNMTIFEKIIFLADKIEPYTRDKDVSLRLKNLLDSDNGLDKAILECYKYTILSLVNRNLKICTQTIEIYNLLLNN